MEQFRGTTIVAVKKDGKTVIAGDGQVTMGQQVILKGTAHKVRRLFDGKVVVGFAGGTADAFAMCEEFEKMLNKYSGSLMRSAVEYAKGIRSAGRNNAEAMMIVADKQTLLILTSSGDVVEPDDGVCAIGNMNGMEQLRQLSFCKLNIQNRAHNLDHCSMVVGHDRQLLVWIIKSLPQSP